MRTRVDEILEEQKKLSDELNQIQEECPHPPLVKKEVPGCADGYSEKTIYWIDHSCGLCLKKWTTEQ